MEPEVIGGASSRSHRVTARRLPQMIRSMSTDDNEDDISLLDLAITIRQNLGLLLKIGRAHV